MINELANNKSLLPCYSDKTDVESTHSSNLSAHRDKMHAIIPPDALYGTVEKQNKFAYVDAADFNDSKVSSNAF